MHFRTSMTRQPRYVPWLTMGLKLKWTNWFLQSFTSAQAVRCCAWQTCTATRAIWKVRSFCTPSSSRKYEQICAHAQQASCWSLILTKAHLHVDCPNKNSSFLHEGCLCCRFFVVVVVFGGSMLLKTFLTISFHWPKLTPEVVMW